MTLKGLLSFFSPEWQTVGIANRSCRFAGTLYPLHGEIDRTPVRVAYQIELQQTARGRRRFRLNCANPAARSSLGCDPLLVRVREWKRGGELPETFA